MKKLIKRSIFLLYAVTLILLFSNINNLKAKSSEVTVKGYKVDGLTYVSDKSCGLKNIVSNKETIYGTVGLWAATYKIVIKNTDNTYNAFYIFLIEGQISSVGKQGKYYFFRNKSLSVDVDFYSTQKSTFVQSTEASEDASGSMSKNFGVGVNISGEAGTSGIGINAGIEGGLSFDYTESYSNINLILNTNGDKEEQSAKNNHSINFFYQFTKWKNGAMISPNIGSITKRMYVIYTIPNYNFSDSYTIKIKTEATVFKDAKWPRKNYTESDSIELYGINGNFGE